MSYGRLSIPPTLPCHGIRSSSFLFPRKQSSSRGLTPGIRVVVVVSSFSHLPLLYRYLPVSTGIYLSLTVSFANRLDEDSWERTQATKQRSDDDEATNLNLFVFRVLYRSFSPCASFSDLHHHHHHHHHHHNRIHIRISIIASFDLRFRHHHCRRYHCRLLLFCGATATLRLNKV